MDKVAHVYIMSSSSRRALYAGITARFRQRVFEHKNDLIEGFSSKYKCHRLVYFERFESNVSAMAREKEIKGWRREKKDRLVESMNPTSKDLAADWFPETLLFQGKPCILQAKNARSLAAKATRDDVLSDLESVAF